MQDLKIRICGPYLYSFWVHVYILVYDE